MQTVIREFDELMKLSGVTGSEGLGGASGTLT